MNQPVKPDKDGDILVFEPFVRTKFPVLICLFGFSGCGKTLSGIKIAQGLGGRTMFLDTETGRGRVYAEDAKGFSYAELTPPFTPERYIAAIKQIERAGFDNLLIDSGSHEWDGLGGMLEIAEANVDSKGKKRNGLGKWSVKSRHKTFMNTMMAGRMNIIICLRAKDKFVERFVDGKKEIVMEGFSPLQERNFKYDMMVQLPMPEGGKGRYLMDETKGFKAPEALLKAFKADQQITSDVGIQIAEWVKTGAAIDELLRQLKHKAMEEAEHGVEHFRAYWSSLPQEKRLQLKPFLTNFESVAKTADLEKEVDDEDGLPAKNLNSAGSDISSLKVGMPKDELTVMIESVKPVRKEEDADWWSLIDQLEPEARLCVDMPSFAGFLATYSKGNASFILAPDHIKKYWEGILDSVMKGFRQKAA